MPIEVQCPGCATTFQASEKVAGKQVKCRCCGGTLRIPAPDAAALEAVNAPDLLSSPLLEELLPSSGPLSEPTQLAGPASWSDTDYASDSPPPIRRSPGMVALAALGLFWCGFALSDSVSRIRELSPVLRMDQMIIVLPAGLGLLLRVSQVVGLLTIVTALAGLMRRRPWAAPLGVAASTINTALSFAWVPLLSSTIGLIFFAMGASSSNGVREMLKFFARIGVDMFVFLLVPAILVFAFRAQLDSKARRGRRSGFTLVMAAASLGWSVFALIKLLTLMAAYFNVMESIGPRLEFDTKLWIIIIGRALCLIAAGVLVAAMTGMLLRQDWAPQMAMVSSGSYALLTLIVVVVQASRTARGGAALGDVVLHMVVPAAVCACLLTMQDSD